MSVNNRVTNKTSRSPNDAATVGNPGPFIAEVIGHLDRNYMGALKVRLLKTGMFGDADFRSEKAENESVVVSYATPFYGVTPFVDTEGTDAYRNTQQSYGFWAVPPDVGSKVLVMFVEGRRDMGYWFACIPEPYMNFMVPDGRAATELTSPATPQNLKGKKLPVGEYNKALQQQVISDPTQYTKPYNKDFTEVLEVQGLLYDEIRGLTTSSARREVPSAVFGINTPGPLDKRLKSPTKKAGTTNNEINLPKSRLGGSSIVMDDGDDKLIRATHAADGPPFYINKEAGEPGGDETIPQNECIRIRTRTGHQILLHNSEDLIYIANSRGTAWIELTSDGKIDIHADDSISIMTNQDLNITAERDINLEAGRNINMKAAARWSDGAPIMDGKESGRVHIESLYDLSLYSGRNTSVRSVESMNINSSREVKVTASGDINMNTEQNMFTRAEGSVHQTAVGSWFRKSFADMVDDIAGSYFTQATGEVHVTSQASIYSQAKDKVHQIGQNVLNEARDAFSVLSSKFDVDGSDTINLNSGTSTAPTPAIKPIDGNTPTAPNSAYAGKPLPTIILPYNFPGATQPIPYDSIVTRSPQREPWTQHENMNPYAFKPEQTDRELPGELPSNDRILTPDTFQKSVSGRKSSVVVPGSGGIGLGNSGDTFYPRTAGGSTAIPAEGQGPLATIRTKRGLTAQVAEVFKDTFQGFVDDLEATGYEIKSIGGYAYRPITGGGRFSYHASGAAIDINPPNPVMNGTPNGYFKPRPLNAPITDMPVAAVRQLIAKWGLGWGGNWTSIDDAMHFSVARAEGGSIDLPANGIIPMAPKNSDYISKEPPPSGRQ